MATRHVIVDGSNLATEGRNMPSLGQLDQAVREFIAENPHDQVTVVVDASFGHRIDPAEVPAFEEAEAAGEVVSPPAGAIGRGDAFLLRIAEKTGATVLSNDSFQEFHGEHTWLFEKGRLVGGKPVPGVGWIFMDRTPVRGAKSREVTKEAKRKKRELEAVAAKPAAADHKAADHKLAEHKAKPRSKSVDRAIARATEEVVEPKAGSKARRRRGSAPPAEPVNEPLAFITFIAAHPLGSDVVGEVLEYSSHGAFVEADGARCYIPLSAMGSPAPRRAREVVTKGETRPFVVQAFDPQRRGIELALPGFENVSGAPTAETVEAEIEGEAELVEAEEPVRARRRGAGKAVATVAAEEAPAPAAAGREAAGAEAAGAEVPPAKAARARKAAKKAAPPAPAPEAEARPARRRAAKRAAPPVPPEAAAAQVAEAPPAEVPPAEAPPARRRAAKKAAEAAPEAAPARKRAGRKAAAPVEEAGEKVVAKKAAARKAPAPERAAPVKKAAPVKNAAATKAAPAKKAAATKAAPAKKAPAKKSPAKKVAATGD